MVFGRTEEEILENLKTMMKNKKDDLLKV